MKPTMAVLLAAIVATTMIAPAATATNPTPTPTDPTDPTEDTQGPFVGIMCWTGWEDDGGDGWYEFEQTVGCRIEAQ